MAESSLRQKTISGMVWVGIQKFGTLFITFVSNMVLARLLTPDDYGMVGMLTIFIAISNTFIDAGLGSALIQKSKPTQEDYTTVFYWNILFSFVLYGVLYLLSPLIEGFYENIQNLSTILRVQSIVIIINALTIVQFNQLRKKMQFKMLARINVISALISVLIAILCALYGFGVWSLVIQQITLSSGNVILLWWFYRWKPKGGISLNSLRDLFNFGSYIMFSGLLNTIAMNMNGLLIGKFFSVSTLGYFTQEKKIEDVSSMGILNVVEQVTYPLLVEVKDDLVRMRNILKKFNVILLVGVVPLMYTIVLMAEPIIIFLFSDKWLPSAPILQILAFAGILICMQGSNYNAIAAIGKSKTLFDWTIIKRMVNCLILLISLFFFGFNGLLWGIVVNAGMIVVCNMYLVAKYIGYKLSQQIIDLVPIIILTTIPFVFFFIINRINLITVSSISIVNDVIYGLSYLIIYVIIILFAPINQIAVIRKELKSHILMFYHGK